MHVCFIPPKGAYHRASLGDGMMLLAQLTADLDYVRQMRSYARFGTPKFVIMDNGAFEGKAVTDEQLLEAAEECWANEVILPDVMGSMALTIDRVREFIRKYKRSKNKARWMGVVQGATIDQVRHCINTYATIPEIEVLGLPKALMDPFQRNIRIDLANWTQSQWPGRFMIHFLGMSAAWMAEVPYTVKYAPHVRSIDTSLPYIYGMENVSIGSDRVIIARNPKYFSQDWEYKFLQYEQTIADNERMLLEWAQGTLLPTVKTVH